MAISETALIPTEFLSSAAFAVSSTALSETRWLPHAPFLWHLAASTRPRVIVDLDADDEAGDPSSSEIFEQAAQLAGGAKLLSGRQAAADSHVAIDCLNFGWMTSLAEAERRWSLWLPRLAADALVLIPGVGDESRDDPSSLFFAQCRAHFAGFALRHHGGLGVIATGATPTALAAFFAQAAEADPIYDRLGQALCDRRKAAEAAALPARVADLEALVRRLDVAVSYLKQGGQGPVDGRFDGLQARIDALAPRVDAVEESIRNLPPPAPPAPDRLIGVEARLSKAERRIARLNWHAGVLMPVTGPIVLALRYLARKAKKFYRVRSPRR